MEAVKKFPLNERGRRRSRPGVVLRIAKASPQRIVSRIAPGSCLGFPASPDNPRAFGAAPFSKGEFHATAGPGNLFTGAEAEGRGEPRRTHPGAAVKASEAFTPPGSKFSEHPSTHTQNSVLKNYHGDLRVRRLERPPLF